MTEDMTMIRAAKALFKYFQTQPTKPELHRCKHCGAPVSRLYLIAGGILHFSAGTTVRMEIGCKDCRRSHKYKGNSVKAHWLALQLSNNSRGIRA